MNNKLDNIIKKAKDLQALALAKCDMRGYAYWKGYREALEDLRDKRIGGRDGIGNGIRVNISRNWSIEQQSESK